MTEIWAETSKPFEAFWNITTFQFSTDLKLPIFVACLLAHWTTDSTKINSLGHKIRTVLPRLVRMRTIKLMSFFDKKSL